MKATRLVNIGVALLVAVPAAAQSSQTVPPRCASTGQLPVWSLTTRSWVCASGVSVDPATGAATFSSPVVIGPAEPPSAPVLTMRGGTLAERVVKSAVGPGELRVDLVHVRQTYEGVARTPTQYQGSAVVARMTMGGLGTAPAGTVHALSAHARVSTSGNDGNEITPLFTDLSADASARLWGTDQNVFGPVSRQAQLIQGSSLYVGNYHPDPASGGVWGSVIVTKPGAGGGDAATDRASRTTYPLDAALAIVGFSGAPSATSGDDAVATAAFGKAIQIGGHAGGWFPVGISKYGTGIDIRDFADYGIYIHDRHPSGVGPALVVEENRLGTDSSDGTVLRNTTAAVEGTPVQASPRTRWTGTAWDSVAHASRAVSFFTQTVPRAGNDVGGTWRVGYIDPKTTSITYPLTISSDGTLRTSGPLAAGTDVYAAVYHASALAIYPDNAQAKAAGLVAGDFYRTAAGVVMVVY